MYVHFFQPEERPNYRSGTTDDDDDDENLQPDPENLDDETTLDDYFMPPPLLEPRSRLQRPVRDRGDTRGSDSDAGASLATPTQSPRHIPTHSPMRTPTRSPAHSPIQTESGQTRGSGSDASTSRHNTPRHIPKARRQRSDNPTLSASGSAKRGRGRGRGSTPSTPSNRGRGRATLIQDPGPRRSPRLGSTQAMTAVGEATEPRRSPRDHGRGPGCRTPGLSRHTSTSNTSRTSAAQRVLKYNEL